MPEFVSECFKNYLTLELKNYQLKNHLSLEEMAKKANVSVGGMYRMQQVERLSYSQRLKILWGLNKWFRVELVDNQSQNCSTNK